MEMTITKKTVFADLTLTQLEDAIMYLFNQISIEMPKAKAGVAAAQKRVRALTILQDKVNKQYRTKSVASAK